MNTKKDQDKLFEFLGKVSTRLAGVGGNKMLVWKENGNMRVVVPFTPAAVYGIVTALQDVGELDFTLMMNLTVAQHSKPAVELILRPSLRSWVWRAFKKGENTCVLETILRHYLVHEGTTKERDIIISRIE